MTDRISFSHGSPSTSFYTEADQYSQDLAANTSTIWVYERAVNNGDTSSYDGTTTGYQNVYWVDASGFATLLHGHTPSPFLPSGVATGATRWRMGPYAFTLTHDTNGNQTFRVRQILSDAAAYNDQTSAYVTLTRIPQVPGAPGTPTVSSTTSNSISLAWTAGTRGHADITSYDITYANNAGFTSPTTVTSTTLSKVVSGLTPGKRYWLKVRAINSDGAGAYSASVDVFIGIAAKKWDGAAEVVISTAVRWDGSAEVPITTAVRWNGTVEVPLS